ERQIGAADALERGERLRTALVPGLREVSLEALEAAPRHIGHERVAVAKMAIGCRRTHAGRARGVGEGEASGAFLGDDVQRRANQLLAQIAVVIAAPAMPMPCHVRKSYITVRRRARGKK